MAKVNFFNKFSTLQRRFCSGFANFSICIVGSGPAGFYSAQQLIKLIPNATVDIFERLPVPFGLVRYGVAPDHADVKNVVTTFTKTAKDNRVNFYGNVCLGRDVSLEDLKNSYHAVLLTYGAEEDRKLGISGEDLKNVMSARRFVGWYNGLPADRDLEVDLDAENVVLIGQGNVAVDVSRILLSSVDKLRTTDITEYALERLSRSRVKNVYFVGRRGPLQIACTIKEMREMINLPGVNTVFNADDLVGIDKIIPSLERRRKRLTELLYKSAMEKRPVDGERNFNVVFNKTPVEFRGDKRVSKVQMAVNRLVGDVWESQKAVVTEETLEYPCDLAFRSIGYKSIQAEPDIPFDDKKGVIVNRNGRISPGVYCSGWVCTGPVGVIISTMTNAFTIAQTIFQDYKDKAFDVESVKPGSEHVLNLAKKKGVQIVRFENWERIDDEERRRGAAKGKSREKIVSISEMLEVAGGRESR